ncbi:MAG: Coproporphyrinogen oxidase [Bacteroidetes bacterium]|nr:Coproporphyrinogen oxidase [Bacteroidota bacterium]
MNAIKKQFTFSADAEITFEVNPDDVTKSSLKTWEENGIDRLSIGLQSFNNEELKWMNRVHTAEESLRSVKMAQDAGFENITIDLIYGSKFQDLKSWEKTLLTAIDLQTTHISSYNLTIENKTALGSRLKKGLEPPVNDELSSSQFIMMSEMLEDAGFVHYEISNFGKPGFFAVHNSNYWLGKQYLGIGPSAHSYNGATRQWNIRSNTAYIQKIEEQKDFFEMEELSVRDKYNEYILTRLRTIWGCDVKEIGENFGADAAVYFRQAAERKSDYLLEEKGIYTLNQKGKLQADGIASDLFMD